MPLGSILLLGLFQLQTPADPSVQSISKESAVKADQEPAATLSTVKRIYVESFGEDSLSKTLHAMVISALHDTKRFTVTENKERADAILKGSTLEKTSQELHAIGSGTSAGVAGGAISGSATSMSATVTGVVGAVGASVEDSQASTETINEARLAVRLVSSEGDVIWATTQESKGAKFRGASADVADKIAKQLLRDIEKLDKTPSGAK